MSAPRTIPNDVRAVQIEAADPDVSAFVSANAGSGKTHVLAQRVINLLLRGCDPAKILCITFTKAAAANMANRVFSTLAAWTALNDDKLDEQIRLSTGKPATFADRVRARRLFASALETPGGLKVQTIHAFCTRLLHQFPFEANVGARFTVLDEASTTQLLDGLTLDVLLEAAAGPESPLGKALSTAIVVAADQTFKDVVGEAIFERDAIAEWLKNAGGLDAAIDALSQSLGLDPDDTLESVEAEYFSASLVPPDEWPALIEVLATGSTNDQKHIAALEAARVAQGRERIEHYLKVFCTAELEPRKNILTKKLATAHPTWAELLAQEQARVCALIARERALASARAHPRAHHHRGGSHRPLRQGKRTPRPARLRGPDRQDAGAVRARVGGLGALQARPRHRPHADRRGAGHQPQAVGDRQTIASEFMPGGARGERQAHGLRGRRREAVDLLVPGRGAQGLRRHAPAVPAPVRHAGARLAASALPPLVPLGAERARLGRPRVRRARGLCQRHHRRDRHPRAPGAARHRAGAGRDLGPHQAGGQEGDRRLGRALRHRERGKPAGAARPPHRRSRQALARARPEGRRGVDPGAPARAAVRGHHPRAEECRRAGRRRRPAGAHRAHRGDGPDGAGRLPAAGGRRPRFGERVEEPAVRDH